MARLALFLWILPSLVCVHLRQAHAQTGYTELLSSTTGRDYDYHDVMASLADADQTTASISNVLSESGQPNYEQDVDATDDAYLQEGEAGGNDPNEDGFDMVEMDDDGESSSEEDTDKSVSPEPSRGCQTGNLVDDSWRCDPNWASRRKNLASCAIGFGRKAIGGKNGAIYVVTSPRDDNPANPAPGTLRYAVTRKQPLWIVFASSMIIKLKNELLITSFKTIDARGVQVRIAGGGGLRIHKVSNVIVHGLFIHDIKATGPAKIMKSEKNVENRPRCDGDAISIFSSSNIWIDHCYLSNAADGLIDVIRGSNSISITNCYFTRHNKVMLLGGDASHTMDRNMHVTVAYNKFGPGLVQRMPRIRYGNLHLVNNEYSSGWGVYPVGGSQNPTILSQGNVYNANRGNKEVTKRIDDGGPKFGGPRTWNWRSEGDMFQSGAYFGNVPMSWSAQSYSQTVSCKSRPASMVWKMVRDAGPLN